MAYNSKYTGQQVEDILDSVGNKQDTISDLATIRTNASKGATAVQPSSLASVATSGSYNDLSDKPTIPNSLGQLTNDKGFVTANDIKASVWECPLEGEIGDILEETDDRDKIELFSEWIGDLSNQRPCLLMYDDPYGYAFVQNYKSHPTFGSGICRFSYIYNGYIYEVEYDNVMLPVTLTIVNKAKIGGEGGGSSAYPEVNHGTSDRTFTLTPNTFHVWDEMTAMTLTLGAETDGVANEYLFQFTSGPTPTSLFMPDDIKFSEDLVIEANKIYQISILKGLGSVLSWDNSPALIENKATYNEGDFMNGATLTFEYPTASEIKLYLNQYSSPYLTIPAETTTIAIDWNEPSAPIPVHFDPSSDNTYIYIIA